MGDGIIKSSRVLSTVEFVSASMICTVSTEVLQSAWPSVSKSVK